MIRPASSRYPRSSCGSRLRLALSAALAALVLGGCNPPGSDEAKQAAAETESTGSASVGTPSATTLEAPVTPEQVAELGEVTLKVWADAGEQATLDHFIPRFEEKYPNVTVETTVKSFDDIVKTVVNAMDSDEAPDLAQGNQGYAVDGTLVKAGLIRPLDDVAAAYAWESLYSDYSLNQFRWNEDGSKWGSGTLYGNSPVTQYIGVFVNKALLAEADVALPESFAELEESLAVLKEAGITPLVFGNADKQAAMHLFGSLAGRCQSPEAINDWVAGKEGASFVNDCNRQAAETIVSWTKSGYVSEGFNGVSMDDAAIRFANGAGAYFIGGDWLAQQIAEVAGDFGFVIFTGDEGKRVSTGASGMGWHVSAKSDATLAALAFVGELHAADYAQALADQKRVPIADPEASSDDPLMADDIATAGLLLADDGQTAYLDWATDTMYDVFGSSLQELMAGEKTAEEFLQSVQENWEMFQAK